MDYECYGIFRWFLGCLYLLCGCLVVDVEFNCCIWHEWILICLFYCLELVRRFLWGLILIVVSFLWGMIFVAITSIPIHSYDINTSNRKTSVFYEDKLMWFISCYLVYTVFDIISNQDGVTTPFGDFFAKLILINWNPPYLFPLVLRQMALCSMVLDCSWDLHDHTLGNTIQS